MRSSLPVLMHVGSVATPYRKYELVLFPMSTKISFVLTFEFCLNIPQNQTTESSVAPSGQKKEFSRQLSSLAQPGEFFTPTFR